jgi:nucleoside-diphosphate-sugar epimerase
MEEMAIKKVVVTGGEGYIGSILMPMLAAEGFEAVSLDSCFYAQGNLGRSSNLTHTVISKDVRDLTPDDFRNNDAVVHLAALSNDPLGKLDEALTLDINFNATRHAAEAAKSAGVKRFVFASSCSLYGAADHVLTEQDAANPQTAYGRSKILAEEALSALAGPDFSPVFLRNATAFGFSPRMRFDIVVNSLTGFAHTAGKIRILGDGTPWRPLVHVVDICRAIVMALRAPREAVQAEAFNIGDSEENYQIRQIAEHVQKHYPACAIEIAQANAGDTRNYMVSFDKARDILGFRAEWSLEAGIAELSAAYTACRLDTALFTAPSYTRLAQIEEWLAQGRLGPDLRWRSA